MPLTLAARLNAINLSIFSAYAIIKFMLANPKQRLFLFLCAGLVIITLAVYWPVRNHEFISFDDDEYVTDNTVVQSGLSRQNVKWAFTTVRSSYWHPLTWLSLMLDCQIFGVKPGPMH
jgi:protein O-mannosyl-transferase